MERFYPLLSEILSHSQYINRKRYRSNQDLSHESENTEVSEEFKPKIRKIVNEESSEEVEKTAIRKEYHLILKPLIPLTH